MLLKGFGWVILLLFLTACGGNDAGYEALAGVADEPGVYITPDEGDGTEEVSYPNNIDSEVGYEAVYTPVYEPTPTPRPATPPPILPLDHACDENRASVICYTCAATLIGMMEARLDWDDGEIWGVNLNERGFMFACPVTRQAAASRQNRQGTLVRQPEGVYTGILPEGTLIGTTASDVFGERWGMATWGFKEDSRDNIEILVAIMAHELFHALQPRIFTGTRGGTVPFPHMDTLNARIQVMIEIEALVYALGNEGEARLQGIYTALSARSSRQESPMIVGMEAEFEIIEGTAVYTEARLMRHTLSEQTDWVMHYFNEYYRNQSLHNFGYFTGALYALLLSELGVDWKTGLRWNTDLA